MNPSRLSTNTLDSIFCCVQNHYLRQLYGNQLTIFIQKPQFLYHCMKILET